MRGGQETELEEKSKGKQVKKRKYDNIKKNSNHSQSHFPSCESSGILLYLALVNIEKAFSQASELVVPFSSAQTVLVIPVDPYAQ